MLDPGKVAASLAPQQANGKNAVSPIVNVPISMGVWDGHGHFLAVRHVGSDKDGHNYQLTIPLDTPLSFEIGSAKLNLADSAGVALPATAAGPAGATSQSSQTAFQHNTGDPNPKAFQFTITGVHP